MPKSIGQYTFNMLPPSPTYADGLATAIVQLDFKETQPMKVIGVDTYMEARQGGAHHWKQGGADNIWYTLSPPDSGLVNSYEGDFTFVFSGLKQELVTLTPLLGSCNLTSDIVFKANTNNFVCIEMMTFNSIQIMARWKWACLPVSTHSNATNPTLSASVHILVEY